MVNRTDSLSGAFSAMLPLNWCKKKFFFETCVWFRIYLSEFLGLAWFVIASF